MNQIWVVLVSAAAGYAVISGRAVETAGAMLQAGGDAVALLITLVGSMTLWSGLLEIMRSSGDVARLGRVLRHWLRPLFPSLDDACWEPLSLNLAANLLGLGNAATPAGIQAAKAMEKQGESGVRALAMLLALNNSSLQLIPTTVMTLRAAHGAPEPGNVWLPMLLSSGVATTVAVLLMKAANRYEQRKGGR